MRHPVSVLMLFAAASLANAAPAAAAEVRATVRLSEVRALDLLTVVGLKNKTTCNCYFSSDCGSGKTCGDYFTCTLSGKLDGLCKSSGGGGSWGPRDLELAARGVDLYFEAVETSAGDIRGQRVEEAAAALQAINDLPLPLAGHHGIQSLASDVLDLALGFDLIHGNPLTCGVPGPVPTFRGHFSGPTHALFAAVREGVVTAVRTNDPGAFEKPLRAFWQRYPKYEPDHSGRCYDHGHDDYPFKGGLDCQLREIRALLEIHLPPREGGESPKR